MTSPGGLSGWDLDPRSLVGRPQGREGGGGGGGAGRGRRQGRRERRERRWRRDGRLSAIAIAIAVALALALEAGRGGEGGPPRRRASSSSSRGGMRPPQMWEGAVGRAIPPLRWRRRRPPLGMGERRGEEEWIDVVMGPGRWGTGMFVCRGCVCVCVSVCVCVREWRTDGRTDGPREPISSGWYNGGVSTVPLASRSTSSYCMLLRARI